MKQRSVRRGELRAPVQTPSGAPGDPRSVTTEKVRQGRELPAGRLAERLAEPAFWGEPA